MVKFIKINYKIQPIMKNRKIKSIFDYPIALLIVAIIFMIIFLTKPILVLPYAIIVLFLLRAWQGHLRN